MKQRSRGVILALIPFALMVLAFQLVPIISMLTEAYAQRTERDLR